MPKINFDAMWKGVMGFINGVIAGDQLDVAIVGGLLVLVLVLALSAIWRGRRRVAAPLPSPSEASGFKRWLTPMGMKSISAEQAVIARPRRKSGSMKSIRVSTPVSKVATRALRGAGADALDIARKTGLARDAVVMMMANANPQPKQKSGAKAPAAAQAPTRTVTSDRAVSAPGAYASAPRTAPPANGRSVGTQFNARLS